MTDLILFALAALTLGMLVVNLYLLYTPRTPIVQPHDHHEWHLGSLEQTAGRTIRSYVCRKCDTPHHERREI